MLSCRNKNLMLFGAWFGQKYDDSSKILFEHISKNHPETKAVWITLNKDVLHQVESKGFLACYGRSAKAVWLALRAKFFVGVTLIHGEDGGALTSMFMGGMTFINLWHGIPLKKIVYDDVYDSKYHGATDLIMRFLLWMPLHKTYHIATSEAIVNRFIGCFKSDKKHVLNLGMARNDFFFLPHDNIFKQGVGKKIVLYMPTHRSEGNEIMNMADILDLPLIEKFCEKYGFLFVIKKHYYHRNESTNLNPYKCIVDITKDNYSSQEMLDAADILITDYSSCYIDYLLLDRPILFYCYDLENYLSHERGLYEDYLANVPGPICKLKSELITFLENLINDDTSFEGLRNQKKDYYYSKQNQHLVSEQIYQKIATL